jgi:hypothetical protein
MIVDGQAKFNCTLVEFYRQPIIVTKIARNGVLIPSPDDVDLTARPALARIDPSDGQARWIADCPDCRSAEYVWLATPVFFCCSCANATIGHRWRCIVVPSERAAIEASVLARPAWIVVDGRAVDPRSWSPDQTLEAVKALTAQFVAQAASAGKSS